MLRILIIFYIYIPEISLKSNNKHRSYLRNYFPLCGIFQTVFQNDLNLNFRYLLVVEHSLGLYSFLIT